MDITLSITDAQQLELLERLRGKMTAQEFSGKCFEAGLKLADIQSKQIAQPMHFAGAKPEFKALTDAALKEALKVNDPKSPISMEIGRLVTAYMASLQDIARKNGNRLPTQMQVTTQVPIERLAFQLTAEAVKASMKKAEAAAGTQGKRG